MRLVRIVFAVVAVFSLLPTQLVSAEIQQGVRIELVQAAGVAAGVERVVIRNYSESEVDITDWILSYSSASGATTTTLVRFEAESSRIRLLIPGSAAETLVSKDFAATFALSPVGLMMFDGGLNHLGGAVSLRDASGTIIDAVGWGAASKNYETMPAPAMSAVNVLVRSGADTDSNGVDFVLKKQSDVTDMTYGGLVELQDMCVNLAGIQAELPEGQEVTTDGICKPVFEPVALQITELLPNPDGADVGNEFIELYNPTDVTVVLDEYTLRIGQKTYRFSDGARIDAGSYLVNYTDELGITLGNSTGLAVELFARDQLMDTVGSYSDAPAGQSWARIGNSWQFTNQVTPGVQNLALQTLNEDDEVSTLAEAVACKEGYYLYESTGRCRKSPIASAPKSCKDGQYRSEETGRCRSIIQTVDEAKPCADDQFRNPATGRCKKIASAEDVLQPCKSGYERNPETNRCRKSTNVSMPHAGYPVEPVKTFDAGGSMLWAFGGAGTLAAGYGAWEWRREASRLLARVTRRG